jgi:hypothetical protein
METNHTTSPARSVDAAGDVGVPPVPGGPANGHRAEQFRADLAQLDVPTPADRSERWFLLGGIVLEVVGILFILGGYLGASGTAILAEQVPYLLSGGMLGLALIIVGGTLFLRYSMTRYLRFWLVRQIYEQRTQSDRVAESVAGLETVLRGSAGD